MTVPLVVMGVSGSGKSTVGRLVAARLGRRFVDADALHSEANIEKMRSGEPLTDDDRWAWLALVACTLADRSTVVACSALRRAYRDALRCNAPDAFFIHLHAAEDALDARLRSRQGHFMPASLLQSQIATLEPLGADEHGVTVESASDPDETAAAAVHATAAALARRREL